LTLSDVDTSALMKRVVVEAQCVGVRRTLEQWNAAGDVLVASTLSWVEVWRSLRRVPVRDLAGTAEAGLAWVAEIPLTDGILERARRIGPEFLRRLDAIHLASALVVAATRILTYDARLADAADVAGFDVVSPPPA